MGKVKEKKVSKHAKERKGTVTLDDIIDLDGKKKDLELFQDVDQEDDFEDYEIQGKDFDSEPISKLDIQNFIENLGLKKHRPSFHGSDAEKEEEERKLDTSKIADIKKVAEKDQPKVEKISKKKKKNKFKVQDDEVSSTTPSSPQKSTTHNAPVNYMANYQPRKTMLIKPIARWYELELSSESKDFKAASPAVERDVTAFANKLIQDESNLYKTQQETKKRSDTQWLKTVLTSGTLVDRVAALTVTIQNSPIHNMAALDSLVSMATKKGRREAMIAVDTLKELFLKDLLPDRKLRKISDRPLGDIEQITSGNHDNRDKHLMVWMYETQLKEKYTAFVQALLTLSHDNIMATKKKAVYTICDLLIEKPEAEKVLLNSLVNKLGDPESKVASLTVILLTKLVGKHPNMKSTVVQEVERLLYRPNVSEKAQYFGVCFLNQLILSKRESVLASKLVLLYFSFFKAFIKKNEVDSKMMGALLTGVNRAYPYAKVETAELEQQVNTLHKVLHVVQFNTAIHALMLLYQVMDSSESTSDRYYMALYRKMLDPALKTSSKQPMFLNLLYKSMKKDISDRRVQAFTKRLLQISGQQNPTFICGMLLLLSEVIRVKPEALRVKQIADSWDEDDDEDEHFTDAPEEDEDSPKKERIEDEANTAESLKSKPPTWLHRKNVYHKDEKSSDTYDPLHRNPVYCRAEKACVWELRKLQHHYHPSVGLFASTVLKGERISYPGDPLQDFTLIRFLDRFVFRNPKKKTVKEDEEEGEGRFTSVQKRKQYAPTGVKGVAVNTEEYLERGAHQIPVDEVFFYRYFERQAKRKKKKREEDEEQSDASVEDDEFDEFLEVHEKGLMAESKREIDFANEMSKELSRKKNAKKRGKKSADDDDSDDDMELSDKEIEMSDDEDLRKAFAKEIDEDADDESSDDRGGLLEGEDDENWTDGEDDDDGDENSDEADADDNGGFGEEDVEFSDDDDFAELTKSNKKGTKRQVIDGKAAFGSKRGKKAKLDKGDTSSLFAAAEEFAHLIDDDAATSYNMTGSQAYANQDNADVKQLKWEMQRERDFKGQSWRKRKGGRTNKMNRSNKGKRKGRKY